MLNSGLEIRSNSKVSVCMITYGHEKYIREAIEGVLMQECDFEVELILSNDCSPDNTDTIVKDIIQNHPRGGWIKYFNHEKNLGMMPNFSFALKECRGDYIALCDGDDYWLNEKKLQKQVDFLDENDEYVIHSGNGIMQRGNLLKEGDLIFSSNESKTFNLSDFLVNNNVCTCTAIFRNIKIDYSSQWDSISFGDWYLYVLLMKKTEGKVFRSLDVLAVYRVVDNGAMKTLSNLEFYQKHIHQIQTISSLLNYKRLNNQSQQIANSYFIALFKIQMQRKLYRQGIKTFINQSRFYNVRGNISKYMKILIKEILFKNRYVQS